MECYDGGFPVDMGWWTLGSVYMKALRWVFLLLWTCGVGFSFSVYMKALRWVLFPCGLGRGCRGVFAGGGA